VVVAWCRYPTLNGPGIGCQHQDCSFRIRDELEVTMNGDDADPLTVARPAD
jgi:hypothetical protein